MATATLLSMLPVLVLVPFAGALIDRLGRHWVMVVADSLIALATLLLGVLSYLGVAGVRHVYLAPSVRSFGDVFQEAAMTTSTALMAPRHQPTQVTGMLKTLIVAGIDALIPQMLYLEDGWPDAVRDGLI